MTNDIDRDLKVLFDDRLRAFTAPPRAARPWSARGLAAIAIATFVLMLSVATFDASSVAAANGVNCADLLTKVRFISQAIALGKTGAPSKLELQTMVEQSGCAFAKLSDGPSLTPPSKQGAQKSAPVDATPKRVPAK